MLLPNQHIVQRGWRIFMPHEDKVDVITPVNIFFRGVANLNVMMVMMMMMMMMMTTLMMMTMTMTMTMMIIIMMMIIIIIVMMMIMIMIMIMTIVSVEQRPAWGEHAVINHIKLRFYQHFVLNRAHPQQTYPFSPVAVTPYS